MHDTQISSSIESLASTKGFVVINDWLASKELRPFAYQKEAWQHIIRGQSGLVNAPTGTGKTFSVFLGAVIQFINEHPNDYRERKNNKLQLLWISPLRALAKDLGRAMEEVIGELGMQWRVAIRNGDTPVAERQKQKRQMPEVLIITPESLHLMLAQKGYADVFKTLRILAVDEWHELMGGKRGVQVELAVSRIVNCSPDNSRKPIENLSIWGISATIGNLQQARDVLLSPLKTKGVIVRADLHKKIEVESIIPDEIEKYPWAGHLGIKLAEKVLPIIDQSRTTLLFINTRGMSEMWYQKLLTIAPELSGAMALHHGSIEMELRTWVEEALHQGILKVVVSTASLDLGVDFRPVDTVIQVGSPKGVARFLQRAGRSGHSPDEVSKVFFLPTHSLELIEAAALKTAIGENYIESRDPLTLCYDVLIQFLSTLAVSDGFRPDEILPEIRSTHCFADITADDWQQILYFLTSGGRALSQYDEYRKIEIEEGIYRIKSRGIAMRHRMHIGTIVSDAMLRVKFMSGGYVGVIEEWFISRLEPGDTFTLAGRQLELVGIKDMTVIVKKSNTKKSNIPSWLGGRLPLSQSLGKVLRHTLDEWQRAKSKKQMEKLPVELKVLKPLFELQEMLSAVPKENELLVEQIETDDGFHLFVYPFEGRLVHEAMAALLAWRISRITPITFSLAMNDYGFELLSDQPIPVGDSNVYDLFSPENLIADIQRSVNATEMAKRKFRDIAVIGGLIFQGFPGEHKKQRHLQASAGLLFNVFNEYEPDNVLVRQAYQEVFTQQMEESRLREMLQRIQQSRIIVTFPQRLTPFCFPIKVDSLRETLTSEKLADRVKRMQADLNR
ncbi:MAG: ligase-associated DNA damage response DEXH box helicase [Flavisolibacter sp.]